MTQTASRPARTAPALGLVVAALGVVVYVVWGSTYLGIRIVVEEAPPLTAMGLRFLTAGLLLGVILSFHGGLRRLRVTRRQLRAPPPAGRSGPSCSPGSPWRRTSSSPPSTRWSAAG